MSRVCALTLRSMAAIPRSRVASSRPPARRTCTHPTMALSGPRSSCESVAMNSSLMRSACSARCRACCSRPSSASRSLSVFRASVLSSKASRMLSWPLSRCSRRALTTSVRRPTRGNSCSTSTSSSRAALGSDLVQRLPQRGNVPLPFAQLVEEPPDRLLGRDPEVVVEAPIRPFHPQAGIQDEQRIAHRLHDPVRVLERAPELEVPALQLLVERRQLLVARLQLLLRRLQLLVDALELLVGRKDLLVRGLQLFVGRLVLLRHGLKVPRGLGELPPQLRALLGLGAVHARPSLGASAARTPGLGARFEEHEQRALLLGRCPERHHLQVRRRT